MNTRWAGCAVSRDAGAPQVGHRSWSRRGVAAGWDTQLAEGAGCASSRRAGGAVSSGASTPLHGRRPAAALTVCHTLHMCARVSVQGLVPDTGQAGTLRGPSP